MPNTKVGPKVAIPPAKSSAAAAAPAPAASQSPAKPVKSPVKKAAITRVTAGPPHSPSPLQHFTFIRLPLSQLPTPCLTILTLKCRRPRGKVCCRCERGNQGAARGKQVPHARHPVGSVFHTPQTADPCAGGGTASSCPATSSPAPREFPPFAIIAGSVSGAPRGAAAREQLQAAPATTADRSLHAVASYSRPPPVSKTPSLSPLESNRKP
jgi:hypothetical protein